MTLKAFDVLTETLANAPYEQAPWLESTAHRLQQGITKLFTSSKAGELTQNLLSGTWFGHPLHPALVLAPAGSWLTASYLDVVGAKKGADAAIIAGIVTAVPAAAAGLADWSYTSGKTRRLGTTHAILNTVALGVYAGSWVARKRGARGLGIGLSSGGFALLAVSAYLGGEISYTLGQGINRNAWSPDENAAPSLDGFHAIANADDVREGRLTGAELEVDGERIPLVLMRHGREVLALNGRCSHMGGPLAEGKIVNEWCVQCPWHFSVFDFRDGNAVQGPASTPQPRYETRIRDGKVEVRLARPTGDVLDRIMTSI
ncbi:MAG: Rieske (2Fe-2S) protein [Chloroflexi bacterium]|nr:Rieske (2Fe-2S) protein [Chloroflexota bacterium]